MKKIKAWLSAIAVIAAVSATFATQYPKSQIQPYQFLNSVCTPRQADCVAPHEIACTLEDGTVMYQGPQQGTSGCGKKLGRP